MFKLRNMLMGMVVASNVIAASAAIPTHNGFFVGISPGLNWLGGNETQTLTLQPDIQKTYTANGSPSFPSIQVDLGWQKPWIDFFTQHSIVTQLGVNITATDDAKLKGDIWEDADPNFNNFNYQYKVQHTSIAMKGKLIWATKFVVDPYVSVNLGVGSNRAYHYTSQPNTSAEVAAPPFHSNSVTAFTYAFGVGLQKALTQHFNVALGYEYSHWGKTQLSRASGQTVSQGLTLNHLYSNQVLLSLFYYV